MIDLREGIRPFSNGTQYGVWTDRNCERCTKSPDDPNSWPDCPIMAALIEAYFGYGYITDETARRMRYHENKTLYTWECGEFEVRQ